MACWQLRFSRCFRRFSSNFVKFRQEFLARSKAMLPDFRDSSEAVLMTDDAPTGLQAEKEPGAAAETVLWLTKGMDDLELSG